MKGQEYLSLPANAVMELSMKILLDWEGGLTWVCIECQGQSKFVPVWRSKSVPLGLKNIGY